MNSDKPFSPSCERNQDPILEILKEYIKPGFKVLEVGSGTGQHGVYFTQICEGLIWNFSDVIENHPGIKRWISHSGDTKSETLLGPHEYRIGKSDFPAGDFDMVFTANSLHIMSWEENLLFFEDLGRSLKVGAVFFVYGPFRYNRKYTSESNKDFDVWLQARDPKSAIRDFEKVCENLLTQGFSFKNDYEMPANNRVLVFQKNGSTL